MLPAIKGRSAARRVSDAECISPVSACDLRIVLAMLIMLRAIYGRLTSRHSSDAACIAVQLPFSR